MADVPYSPLTRKRRTFSGSSQIWSGGDHLLLVVTNWWVQKYHRFRLREIQGITVARRPGFLPLQIVLLVVSALLLAAAMWATASTAGRVAWGVLSAPVIFAQIVDITRGPRARVILRTAVSEVRLPAISRLRAAREFLRQVEPAIRAAQSDIAPLTAPPAPGAFSLPPPAIPADRLPKAMLYTLLGSAFLGSAGSLFAIAKNLTGPLAAELWTIALLALASGIYAVVTVSKPLLRVLAVLLVAAILVDMGVTVWAWAAMISERRATLAMPPWFVRYAWVAHPAQMLVAAIGGALAWRDHRRASDKLKGRS